MGRIRGTTYILTAKDFPERNFSGGRQYGLLPEVAKLIPELAVLYADGYYALYYTKLIPMLTKAIKEATAR
ncbi:MAG: hypothetical protein SFV52_15800 [Saprospiraceae bacterium]|nr:hypothetical protein [Saprospiraceae bacterium]